MPREPLLHTAIGPDDDGNRGSERARLVHGGLTQFGATLTDLWNRWAEDLSVLGEALRPYLGIVEEAWPTIEDLTDPMRFYRGDGSVETMNANITTMIEHVSTFIDFDTFRNLTLSEYILKTR